MTSMTFYLTFILYACYRFEHLLIWKFIKYILNVWTHPSALILLHQLSIDLQIASVMWWYFFSKAIELMDTVLMVLRKKNNQISFLHVFHHVVMLNVWWWCMMFLPGGLSKSLKPIDFLTNVDVVVETTVCRLQYLPTLPKWSVSICLTCFLGDIILIFYRGFLKY